MFRVQLAYNTLQKEITDLEDHKLKRSLALELSRKELDDDRKEVMNFVNGDNQKRQYKENFEKELIRQKGDKEEILRRQENQI